MKLVHDICKTKSIQTKEDDIAELVEVGWNSHSPLKKRFGAQAEHVWW